MAGIAAAGTCWGGVLEDAREVGAGGDGELAEGVAEVGFHGGLGDEQVLGDLAVGQAVGGEGRDAAFGAGQGVRAGQGGAAGPARSTARARPI